MVFSTRPAMIAPKKMIPSTSRPTRRQFSRIQLTLSATAAPTRHVPMVMKKAIVLARLVMRMAQDRIVVEWVAVLLEVYADLVKVEVTTPVFFPMRDLHEIKCLSFVSS